MDKQTYFTDGVDVNVVLGLLRVRDERFNEELAENASDGLNLDVLCGTSLNPLLSFLPGLVQSEKAGLSSPLDQLVWFGDKLGPGGQEPWVDDLSLVKDILHGSVFGEV